MKIDIEKYIKHNRQALDSDQPNESMLWEGINRGLTRRERGTSRLLWRVAAAAVFIVAVAAVSLKVMDRPLFTKSSLAEIDSELGEREKQYLELVTQKTASINRHGTKKIEIVDFLMEELKFLDKIYEEAMADLEQTGYSEQIVNIIFDTYEKRIEILEQIILEIQKSKIEQAHETKILL